MTFLLLNWFYLQLRLVSLSLLTWRKSLNQDKKSVRQRIQYLIMHAAPTISGMSEDDDVCPVDGHIYRVSNASHPSSFALCNAIHAAYVIPFGFQQNINNIHR